MTNDKYSQVNLKRWNERVDIHAKSKFYDVAGFKRGKSSLHRIEKMELGGEVKGKSLLHLMCHYNDTTLSNDIQFEWTHSISDFINALTSQGLLVGYLHEFDYSVYKMYPFMEQRGKYFYIPETMTKLPLMFSLKAKKPH